MISPLITKIHTLLLLIIVAGCTGDDKLVSRSHPVVSTYAVSDINDQGATLNGEILDLGEGVSDHGFLYGTYTVNPTTLSSSDVISLGAADNATTFTANAVDNLIAGTIYYVRAFAVSKTTHITVFGQEVSFVSKGSAAPTIKDFNPKQAIAGDTIVIEGSGFSSVASNNTVWIGDGFAPVTKATPGKLWAVVFHGTPVGESDVMVSVSGRKVTSTSKFSLIKMTVTSFEPNLVAFGDTVWFHGTNLPLVNEISSATIFSRTAHTVSSNRTLVGCVVSNDAGSASSNLVIAVGSQSATLAGPIQLKPPIVTSFTPASGPGGTVVTIVGENFNPDFARNMVSFGTTPLEVTAATRTTLTVKIAANAALVSNNFTVTTFSTLSATSSGSFTVTK